MGHDPGVAHTAPHESDGALICGMCDCAPFTVNKLQVAAPGQHPGGRRGDGKIYYKHRSCARW